MLIIFFICPFSFSQRNSSVIDFAVLFTLGSLFLHLKAGKVYCVKETEDAYINFDFFSNFFLFHLSLLSVMHMENIFNTFTGTSSLRNFKNGTKAVCDKTYCVRNNQLPMASACHYIMAMAGVCELCSLSVIFINSYSNKMV